MLASDLTPAHLGHRVHLHCPSGTVIYGELRHVEANLAVHEVTDGTGHTRDVLGATTIDLTVGEWTATIPATTTVALLP